LGDPATTVTIFNLLITLEGFEDQLFDKLSRSGAFVNIESVRQGKISGHAFGGEARDSPSGEAASPSCPSWLAPSAQAGAWRSPQPVILRPAGSSS